MLVKDKKQGKSSAVAAAAVVQILFLAVTDYDKTVINFGEVI